ncbi:hypothetical protein SAY86_002179 [Trapa natans]|uniref:Uncharacterized protein n=1 Tax=Trapa natans TaxID=22666 RepID=A0AAN7LHE0_TRANT|nr:hypothetical protein SAY86_002179 [Trapa natans]
MVRLHPHPQGILRRHRLTIFHHCHRRLVLSIRLHRPHQDTRKDTPHFFRPHHRLPISSMMMMAAVPS